MAVYGWNQKTRKNKMIKLMKMFKSIVLITLMLFVILIAGCAQQNVSTNQINVINQTNKFDEAIKNNPRQALLDYYHNKFDKLPIKLTYLMKISMLTLYTLVPEIYIDLYKLNNESKTIMSYGGTTTATYYMKGFTVVCTETTGYYSTQSSISCKRNDYGGVFAPRLDEAIINQAPITYNGTKKIIDRTCDDFILLLNSTQSLSVLSSMFGSSMTGSSTTNNETSMNYEICMDREYGYPALYNATLIGYSQLSREATYNLFSFKVTEMSKDVIEYDLKIPVSFMIGSVNCNTSSIKFNLTSLQGLSNPKIDIKLSSYYNKNLTYSVYLDRIAKYETYLINTNATDQLSGSYTVNVCIGSDCQSSYCYVYKSYR